MHSAKYTLLRLTAVSAAAAAALLPAGCSSSGSGCTAPAVTLQNVALSDITAAFDVHATVKSPDGGKPLAGVSVEFWAWGSTPGKPSSLGVPLGTVRTDPSGDATLHVPPIVQGNGISKLSGLSGLTFAKVSADTSALTVAGTPYCAAKASIPVTCGSAAQTCPPVSDRP